jgi:NADPH2:quinone reductase
MHAWLCENPVGVDALVWKELPTPVPRAGEVLVEIKAASLNFPDLLIVQNKYQFKPPLPFVPGSEFSGIVQELGEGVTHLKPGQRVACLSGTGGFGTHAVVPAQACVLLPDGFAMVDAAAFIMTYATSHHALIDRAALRTGETVLVLGAAGGVGTAAIQIAKAVGARVIAAASTDDKCALCASLGADATINYSTQNLRESLKALTGGKGPDVIYDPVGGDFAEPAFRSNALLKGASIVGVFWGDYARREPASNAAMMMELARWYGEGKIKPVIDSTMPLAELKAAYAHMGTRGVKGKLVMVS